MQTKQPIYLDYNATTPLDEEVIAAMEPFFRNVFGNPSSNHWFGVQARKAVEKARTQVATLLNCDPEEIIFTSGGTESNNLALKGIALALKSKGNHIITSSIEHPAIIEVCDHLSKQGFRITYLPVDDTGLISCTELEQEIKPETILISIMHANNEVGTIQPIAEISEIARKHGIIVHTDAAQSAGKISVDIHKLGVDLLSLAGHKLYAPKGIGALFIKSGTRLAKIMHGADHEHNLRAGTENTMEIAGLGKACEVAQRDLGVNQNRLLSMRDRLHKKIVDSLSNVYLNGHPDLRLPNTLNLSFENLEANLILSELTSVAASAGAACHSDDIILSPVLQAMKLPLSRAMGAIRFSIGKMTTEEEIDKAAEAVIETVSKLQPATRFHPQTESEQDYQLTRFTAGLGCACKLRPQALEKVLSSLTGHLDKRILVGNDTADDAAVFQLDANTALVQTVDFFTPIVDDPYRFGAIAAANSLSDIYAMGAQPLLALNIVGFPSNRLPLEILTRILQGARDKAAEAGISIAGGHTIDDPEPKFGLVVLGTVHPDKILRNSTAQDGDALILTKPLGTGIISTATKKGFASKESEDEAYRVMSSLNNKAAEIMQNYPVSACTDITGFGLLGHLREMIINTNLQVKLYNNRIPQLPDLKEYIAAGAVPGGTLNNLDFVDADVIWDDRITKSDRLILADAQTSGGLLITLPAELEKQFMNDLQKNQVEQAEVIGYLSKAEKPVIHVVQ